MSLTRFYDRFADGDGPVSGALQVHTFYSETAAVSNTTRVWRINMPAGAKFKVTDVRGFFGTVGASAPNLTVGTTASGTQIVASADVATGLKTFTVKSYTPAATGIVEVRLTMSTTATQTIALPISVTVTGHVFAPPTSVATR